ncbi:hypothetical protein Efla_007437 [Eimeria flavescens]
MHAVAAVTGGAVPLYASTRAAVRQIYEQQGIRGLWQGVSVTAAASSVSWACFRLAFDSLRLRCPKWRAACCGENKEITERIWLDDAVSGLLAGLGVTLLTHPLWLAKARMEMQAKETEASGWPRFRSGFDCLLSAARGGLKTSYKGIGPALALTPHVAIQMAVYEHLKESSKTAVSVTTGLPAVWGAVSKFAALSCTYPLQVIRSRQQVHRSPYEGLNFLQLAGRMVREEGVLSLFGGFWPASHGTDNKLRAAA